MIRWPTWLILVTILSAVIPVAAILTLAFFQGWTHPVDSWAAVLGVSALVWACWWSIPRSRPDRWGHPAIAGAGYGLAIVTTLRAVENSDALWASTLWGSALLLCVVLLPVGLATQLVQRRYVAVPEVRAQLEEEAAVDRWRQVLRVAGRRQYRLAWVAAGDRDATVPGSHSVVLLDPQMSAPTLITTPAPAAVGTWVVIGPRGQVVRSAGDRDRAAWTRAQARVT